jgi:uncharacterized MnhB-related membrane protein
VPTIQKFRLIATYVVCVILIIISILQLAIGRPVQAIIGIGIAVVMIALVTTVWKLGGRNG